MHRAKPLDSTLIAEHVAQAMHMKRSVMMQKEENTGPARGRVAAAATSNRSKTEEIALTGITTTTAPAPKVTEIWIAAVDAIKNHIVRNHVKTGITTTISHARVDISTMTVVADANPVTDE